ncbi:MAG: hypothetical protein ACPGC4_01185 [Litorivicinaceae bacterium]
MGSSPKKQDYEPTDSDRANASVAMAEYNFFKENYDPLLQQMRDESMTRDQAAVLRSRANADTMQALTSGTSYQETQRVGAAGDLGQALQGQLGIADRSGLAIQNQMRTNVLGTARGQAADAQTGMGKASRLDTSTALSRAKANQQVAQSKLNAGFQVGSALVGQGIRNYGQTGNIFTPGIGQMDEEGNFSYRPANSLQERFRVGSRTIGGLG